MSSRRLHRWSVLFLAGDSLKGLMLPLAAALFASQRSRWDLWLLVFSVPVPVFSVWRYFTTWYEIGEDELIIRTGLLSRNVRHIRYARIHNIERVQNPLHRLLRVAELRLETGGASEQDAKLRVLSVPDAEDVRRRVIEGKRRAEKALSTPAAADAQDTGTAAGAAPAETEAPGARTILRLGRGDIVVFGLTQNRGGIVIGSVLGILWEADVLDFGGPARFSRYFVRFFFAEGRVFNDPTPGAILLALAGLLGLLAVIRILSVAWSVVQLHGFTLSRHGDELRTERGLLTRVHGTIPLARAQLVTVRRAPLMRMFGRAEVRVQTAGGDAQATPGREWLAPSVPAAMVDRLVAEVWPDLVVSAIPWQPAHRLAAWRSRRTALRWVLVAFAVALVFPAARGAAWVALVPALVTAWIAAGRSARSLGHALLPDHAAARAGWLWRHVSIARYAKVQSVSLSESPFDRRWGMADVAADTAGGGDHRLVMPMLGIEEARRLRAHLRERARATVFRW